jgi:SAM-dependent methyltransferase
MPYSNSLSPIATVRTRAEFEHALRTCGGVAAGLYDFESGFEAAYHGQPQVVRGICQVCSGPSDFMVTMDWGGSIADGLYHPNWREQLACTSCGLNNRLRLIGALLLDWLSNAPQASVYLMEQVTPIYRLLKTNFPSMEIIGSEYLGEYLSGTDVDGLRHENVEALSFANDSLDLIVSNEVFEHVVNPLKGFAECLRVLKPGGIMLATFPFHCSEDVSVTRAFPSSTGLVHKLPPVYHGNPVSESGSLVFTDFGWDLFEDLRRIGFSDARIDLYRSVRHGHLGGVHIQFQFEKRSAHRPPTGSVAQVL